MATYEYECTACKHLWEQEQSIKDEPIKKCPACKKQKAKRMISKTNFQLVGGGWASEGYKSS
jgi:putative FmdB family regulatory protein